MNSDIEKITIYNRYIDLFYYSYNIIKKFPKYEREVLCADIRKILQNGYKNIIYAFNECNFYKKLRFLESVSSDLKILSFYVRISYKEKYISIKNYESWSRKINYVDRNLINWKISCQKKLK